MASPTSNSQYSITDTYQVDTSTNNIDLSLTFGPVAVAAMTKVKLEDNVLANGQVGSFNLTVGQNASLNGRFLSLYIIVTVTSATPVPASVTVDINMTGGLKPYSNQLSSTVTNSGGSVIFLVDIFLTQFA
jgi:hypothetical protein